MENVACQRKARELGRFDSPYRAVARIFIRGGIQLGVQACNGMPAQTLWNARECDHDMGKHVSSRYERLSAAPTGSAQIATGNADLSQRTEEQASALQQTAATMDELGTTVHHNADNAKQASRLAAGASQVATKGGEVVSRVVDTMKGINDSSKQIAVSEWPWHLEPVA